MIDARSFERKISDVVSDATSGKIRSTLDTLAFSFYVAAVENLGRWVFRGWKYPFEIQEELSQECVTDLQCGIKADRL